MAYLICVMAIPNDVLKFKGGNMKHCQSGKANPDFHYKPDMEI